MVPYIVWVSGGASLRVHAWGRQIARGAMLAVSSALMVTGLSLLPLATVTAITRRLHDSWLGLALNTLRDDEIAARCCGISVTRGKLTAFCIGNAFIGLGGAFYAVMVGFVSPPDFDFGYSLIMLSVIIIGGVDSIPGVVLGAGLLLPLPERFRFLHEYRLLLYGLVIVVMLLYRPQGLWPALPSAPRDSEEDTGAPTLISEGAAKK